MMAFFIKIWAAGGLSACSPRAGTPLVPRGTPALRATASIPAAATKSLKIKPLLNLFLAFALLACACNAYAAIVPAGPPTDTLVNFHTCFKWKGSGEMPSAEKEKLIALADATFHEKKKLIFFSVPEKEKIWKQLLDGGADSIQSKHPEKFSSFYKVYRLQKEKKGGCHCVRM